MNKEQYTITNETRPHHLKDFCGDNLLQYTGQTVLITEKGKETVGMGDTIVKNWDNTFSLIKGK